MSSGVGPPDDPRGVPSPGTPAPTVLVVGDRVDGEREPDIYIDGRVVHVAIDFFLLSTEYIYMLNRDIYCTQGAAMGPCANWPTMLPPSKSSAPVLPGPGPLPLANWRVHRVAAPAPPVEPRPPLASWAEGARPGASPVASPGLRPTPQGAPARAPWGGLARAFGSLVFSSPAPPSRPPDRPTPSPRQLAPPSPSTYPAATPGPLPGPRRATGGPRAPGPEDRGPPPAARG